LSLIINTGSLAIITGKLQGEALEQVNTQITILATTAPYLFLVSGIERVFAIGIQISLSVIVFYAVFCKDKWWLYPVSIIIHAIIDSLAALMQAGAINNVFLVEGIVGLSSIILVFLARFIHEKLKYHLMQ
jgi:uncharacterized membrane protein YhfC